MAVPLRIVLLVDILRLSWYALSGVIHRGVVIEHSLGACKSL